MIQRNTVIQTFELAVGEFAQLPVGFVSDTPLAGKVIKFNPGIYTTGSEPSGIAFQILYPMVAGKYEMTRISCKNYKAYIEVISTHRFIIEYHFFVTRDLGDWLPDAPFALANAFNTDAISAEVGFYVKCQNESVIAGVPVEIQGQCGVEVAYDKNEFVPGVDLHIKASISGRTVSNNAYVGIIKDNLINQNDLIVPGLLLSYSKIDNSHSAVSSLPDILKAGSKGFQMVSGVAQADIVIDGSYLVHNGAYRVYVVFFSAGIWHSCISEPIVQKTTRVPIVPDVASTVSSMGSTVTSACVTGLSNLKPATLVAQIDISDYNSQLSSLGYTDTFSDYYVSAKAFIAQSANAMSGINLTLTSNPATGTFTVSNFTTTKAQVFVIIQMKLLIDGVEDIINVIFDLKYNPIKIPFYYKVYDEDGNQVEEMCDGVDHVGNKIFTCDLYQSIDGGTYVDNDIITNLDIDLAKIPFDARVCFKAVCAGVVATPGDCDCPDCPPLVAVAQITHYQNGQKKFEVISPDNVDVEHTFFMWGGGTHTPAPILNGPIWTDVLEPPQNTDYYQFEISKLTKTIGTCEYGTGSYLGLVVQGYEPLPGHGSGIDYIEEIQIPLDSLNDCECPPVLVCDNYAAYAITCDKDTQEVTIGLHKSFSSSPEMEENKCSIDGGRTYIDTPASITGEANIFLRYTATFDDGCPPVNIEQVVQCKKNLEVLDDREIDLTIDGDDLLQITLTDNFGNTAIEDMLYVSLDGGETWLEFDLLDGGYVPIQLFGGESIMAYSNTVFLEKVEDVKAQKTLKGSIMLANCPGYSAYGLTVNYDSSTGTFTATKSGNEGDLIHNELLWTLNSGDPFQMGGIPYTGPLTAEGIFIAAWKIQLANCAPKIIYAVDYGRGCIKICNFDEIPMPQVTLIDCCEECPGMSLSITCVNRTLTLAGAPGGATITWSGPDGFIDTGNPVTFPANTSSGTFTAEVTDGACTYFATYNYTKPNAGVPVGDPIPV